MLLLSFKKSFEKNIPLTDNASSLPKYHQWICIGSSHIKWQCILVQNLITKIIVLNTIEIIFLRLQACECSVFCSIVTSNSNAFFIRELRRNKAYSYSRTILTEGIIIHVKSVDYNILKNY